jgi:hypothetical protein
MTSAIRAGLLYFVAVFAVGFVLGAIRVTWLVPRLGALTAVAIELPLMLAASWGLCGVILRRWPVAAGLAPRLVMGGVAFALLMAVEFALAVWGFGQTPAAYAAGFGTAATRLGLFGQLGFALMPLLRRRT